MLPKINQKEDDRQVIKSWTELAVSRLSALHGTDIIKKDRKVIEPYDGSGRVHIPSISKLYQKHRQIMLPQKKRKGFLKDKPDLIILLDISASMNTEANHYRVLAGAIGKIFLADLNKIHLITIGKGSSYYQFGKFAELEDWLYNEEFYDGGTNYASAFKVLSKTGILQEDRPRLVVMITDGCPNELKYELNANLSAGVQYGIGKGDFKHVLSKDYLSKIISQISSLCAVRDTVYSMVVIHHCQDNSDYDEVTTEEELRENLNNMLWRILEKLKTPEDKEDAKILIDGYIKLIKKYAVNVVQEEFDTGVAYNKIVQKIKKDIIRFESTNR